MPRQPTTKLYLEFTPGNRYNNRLVRLTSDSQDPDDMIMVRIINKASEIPVSICTQAIWDHDMFVMKAGKLAMGVNYKGCDLELAYPGEEFELFKLSKSKFKPNGMMVDFLANYTITGNLIVNGEEMSLAEFINNGHIYRKDIEVEVTMAVSLVI